MLYKVDCKWGDWGEWTTCSQTCETSSQKGSQSRERSIVRQATKGGATCAGDDTESQDCPGTPCPSNSIHNFQYLSFGNRIYSIGL